MSERFLPGFDTAPASNRLLVTGQCPADIVFTGIGKPEEDDRFVARADLERKQAFADAIDGYTIVPDDILSVLDQITWNALSRAGSTVIKETIADMDLSRFSKAHPGTREYQKVADGAHDAALGGIATIAAFLEVIPKAAVSGEFERPACGLAQVAMRSKGFIIEWLGLQDQVDVQLAYALSAWKPRMPYEVFENLHFRERYFTFDGERVGLDPAKSGHLRGYQLKDEGEGKHSHPSVVQPHLVALFGCPARRLIPKMYGAMTEVAASTGLMEQTYHDARQNLGYA